MREKVIKLFHDAEVGGHQGREKTKERIRQRAYWYGMATDVDIYIATCLKCSVNKRSRNPRKNFRQDIQEIERIWTWGPFVKFLRATSMF